MRCTPIAPAVAALCMVVGLIGCSGKYRYVYQDAKTQSIPTQLNVLAGGSLGDRYKVESDQGFIHQAPFTPNKSDNLPVPRPVPMHSQYTRPIRNLRDRGIDHRVLADIAADARSHPSLRIDLPLEVVDRALRTLFDRAQVEYDPGSENIDKYVRTDCAVVYQLYTVDALACIYSTLSSSYVAFIAEADDEPARNYGSQLLEQLLDSLDG